MTYDRTGWFKSSRSTDNANCVEIRFAVDTTDIRDSKNPDGPRLSFARSEWASFLRELSRP